MSLKTEITFSYLQALTTCNGILSIITCQDFLRILRSSSVTLHDSFIPVGERNRMLAPGLEAGCILKTFISTNLGYRGCQEGRWIWLWFFATINTEQANK